MKLLETLQRFTYWFIIGALLGAGIYGCYLNYWIAGGFALFCVLTWTLGAGWRGAL